MKHIWSYILWMICLMPLFGQNNSLFQKDIKQPDVHFLETTPITFVIRGNYTYSFQLLNNEKGMQGSLISKDGVIPEKGDELIFVNIHNDRKSFEFYDYPDEVKRSGRPIYQNFFFIDNEDIQWLLTYKIINFYVKKTKLLQMRKFSLSESRAQKLIQILSAFNDQLDRTLINKPDIVQTAPNTDAPRTKWFEPEKSKAVGQNTSIELQDLIDVRSQNKEKILLDIEEENKQAELIKDQLREEVAQARLNAELQKEKYAKEVKRARELSLEEIDKINSETASHVAEQKELSEQKTEDLAWEVYNAKIKSAEAISRIKNRSDEKIIDHENELTNKISELDQNYKEAQEHYSQNVQMAKHKAVEEINSIRKRSQMKMDSLKASLLEEQTIITGKRQDKLSEENEAIYRYKEMILDSLAQMEESLARLKEKNAQEVAHSQNDYRNKMILLNKENALEVAELKNRMETERSKIKVNAVEEIERYNEALREAKEIKAGEMASLKSELDSVRYVHESLIIKERHKLERELQEIAAAVVTARDKSGAAVALASERSVYRISEIQNMVEARRVELLKDLEADREKVNEKRNQMQREYLEYRRIQTEKKDSIQLHYVSVYQNLKQNFDDSLFKTKVRNDSLIGAMERDYENLKRIYADSVQMIRARATRKMREIDQQSIDEDEIGGQVELKDETRRATKGIVQIRADHEERILEEKEKLAKEMVLMRRGHRDQLAEIQENIKNEVNAEFARLKDVRLSFREEMDIMNNQFRSFKKQQKDRINDESERFKEIMAATRLNQLNELLELDSIHNATKSTIIEDHSTEQKRIQHKLNTQLNQLKDSLQTQYQKYNFMLDKLSTDYSAERDSIRKQEVELVRLHNEKIKMSEQNMLEEISKNERISANEVYKAKQNARDEIAKIKKNTISEIKEIQSQKKTYEEELLELEQQIRAKKVELRKLDRRKK